MERFDYHGWLVVKNDIGVRGKKKYQAPLRSLVNTTVANASLLYRHTHGTAALLLSSFNRALTVHYLKSTPAKSSHEDPCHQHLATKEQTVMLDLTGWDTL
jgi:hypothetical protein